MCCSGQVSQLHIVMCPPISIMNHAQINKATLDWSNMTLKYRMIVERYPNPNGVVGNLILDREIFSQIDQTI